MLDEWLTLEEAAAYLKVSKPTIYRFCSEGCLPFYKLAGTGQRRFKRPDLDGLLTLGQPAGRPRTGPSCEELVGEAMVGRPEAMVGRPEDEAGVAAPAARSGR